MVCIEINWNLDDFSVENQSTGFSTECYEDFDEKFYDERYFEIRKEIMVVVIMKE